MVKLTEVENGVEEERLGRNSREKGGAPTPGRDVRSGLKQGRLSLENFRRPPASPLNTSSLRTSTHISILLSVHPKLHLFPSLTLHSPHPVPLCPT